MSPEAPAVVRDDDPPKSEASSNFGVQLWWQAVGPHSPSHD
jgi:hypothetical protein